MKPRTAPSPWARSSAGARASSGAQAPGPAVLGSRASRGHRLAGRLLGRLSLLFALAGPTANAADLALGTPSRVPLAADAVPADTTPVTVRHPADAAPRGFTLAHQLQYGAESGRAVVRRGLWGELAAAFASVPVTGPAHVERRRVGPADVLIRKVASDDGTAATTFYLPPEVLAAEAGKWTFGFESAPSRTRNTTTEVTTLPLRASLAYAHQPREDRAVEGKLALGRTYLSRRERSSLRDEHGDLISFREVPGETIQDTRTAGLDLASYWTVARGTRLGQLETGLTAGGGYESDEINLLDQRLVGYLGFDVRASSETVDGRWGSLGVRLGGSDERFLLLDPVYDPVTGELVGTATSTEHHRLPTWELVVAGATPIYRLHGHTLASVEARASLLRSFTASDGNSGRPASSEQRASFELGLAFELPVGTRIGVRARLDSLDLPGEAGRRIDDVQWVSGMTAGLTLRF
jgi:hypothetical protein